MCALDRHSSHRPLTDSTADIFLMMDEIISITSNDDVVDPETHSANEQKRARLAARLARRTAAVSSDSTSSTASSLLESFHTPFKTLVAGTSSESRTLAQSHSLSLALSEVERLIANGQQPSEFDDAQARTSELQELLALHAAALPPYDLRTCQQVRHAVHNNYQVKSWLTKLTLT